METSNTASSVSRDTLLSCWLLSSFLGLLYLAFHERTCFYLIYPMYHTNATVSNVSVVWGPVHKVHCTCFPGSLAATLDNSTCLFCLFLPLFFSRREGQWIGENNMLGWDNSCFWFGMTKYHHIFPQVDEKRYTSLSPWNLIIVFPFSGSRESPGDLPHVRGPGEVCCREGHREGRKGLEPGRLHSAAPEGHRGKGREVHKLCYTLHSLDSARIEFPTLN